MWWERGSGFPPQSPSQRQTLATLGVHPPCPELPALQGHGKKAAVTATVPPLPLHLLLKGMEEQLQEWSHRLRFPLVAGGGCVCVCLLIPPLYRCTTALLRRSICSSFGARVKLLLQRDWRRQKEVK